MPSSSRTVPAQSGITTSESGERHIPSSTRADGTVRKEIRVRPGYRPPEDVEVYKHRTAEAWKDRGKGGIPGSELVEPVKPRARAKKTKAVDTTAGESDRDASVDNAANGVGTKPEAAAVLEAQVVDPAAEKEKEAKKLSKRLRQARELKQKKDKGDSLLPEQFEKVIRINELIRQLDLLGFDADGQLKP